MIRAGGVGPLVSIILCGFDQGAYVKDAVESVLRQTYPRVELLAIDNGSTDGSKDILRLYADRENVRLFLHDENRPVTLRLNEAIRAAQGEFVSILYADDYYLPDKTARQVRSFADLSSEYGVVYAPGYRLNVITGERWFHPSVSASGHVLGAFLEHYDRALINPISPLVRRECFERYPFHEDVFQEGEAIYFRIALRYRFHYLGEPLVVMREHRSNLNKAYELNGLTWMRLFDKLQSDPDFPAALGPILGRARIGLLRSLGWQMVRLAGDPARGRRYLLQAVGAPRDLAHPRLVVGLVLSLLPRPLLRSTNRLVNLVRRHRSNLDVREDYA